MVSVTVTGPLGKLVVRITKAALSKWIWYEMPFSYCLPLVHIVFFEWGVEGCDGEV